MGETIVIENHIFYKFKLNKGKKKTSQKNTKRWFVLPTPRTDAKGKNVDQSPAPKLKPSTSGSLLFALPTTIPAADIRQSLNNKLHALEPLHTIPIQVPFPFFDFVGTKFIIYCISMIAMKNFTITLVEFQLATLKYRKCRIPCPPNQDINMAICITLIPIRSYSDILDDVWLLSWFG